MAINFSNTFHDDKLYAEEERSLPSGWWIFPSAILGLFFWAILIVSIANFL
jgi:hypothetical protein